MMDAEDFRPLPRFADISGPALAWLCERADKKKYAQGETIFLEGDDATHFYMVAEGEVKIFKILDSGREVILGIFRTGEAIGEVAILDGDQFPACAVAQRTTTMLRLARKDYLGLLEIFPEVARSFIRDLTLRMRAMRVRVETLSESGVPSRMALLLQSFGRELGREVAGEIMVPVKLSRADIAGMVGARTETVIRIMSRWQKAGIVSTDEQGFLIKDLQALERFITGEG